MEPENTVRTEIRDELALLSRKISLLRKDGATQQDIEGRTAEFEEGWRATLVTAQKHETIGRQIQVREQVVQQDLEMRGPAMVKDNALMRGMVSKDAPVAYWESAPSRGGVEHEYELAKKTNVEFERVKADTQLKYKAMGNALTLSLENIETGQEPNFNTILTEQLEKERQLARRQEFDNAAQKNQQTQSIKRTI